MRAATPALFRRYDYVQESMARATMPRTPNPAPQPPAPRPTAATPTLTFKMAEVLR
jgi:hypothetical protein